MDVEHTIEFILEMQAKHEVSLNRFDRRMDAVMKLITHGMKLIRDNKVDTDRKIDALIEGQMVLQEQARRTDAKFAELAESQLITDQKFQAFLDHFGKGRNGN